MKHTKPRKIGYLASIATASLFLSACASLTEGYANSWVGFKARGEMCKSVRTFVRSPLPEDGLRRAWFLPFGSYEDGSVDFYAPMASDPSDDHSSAFYSNRVGQLTHYHLMPSFASIMANCLGPARGFSRIREDTGENSFRATTNDRRTGRRIEVVADRHTATVLVVAEDWIGEIENALQRSPAGECDE